MTKERELLFKIAETWGNAVITSAEREEWLTGYAKEKAIAFGEWVDINAIRNGEHEWKYRGDNYTKKYTTEQLCEIFNQQNQ